MRQLAMYISLFLLCITQAYASSSMYQNKIYPRKHYTKINTANGAEAQPIALTDCEKAAGVGNCNLIYTTDSGGYGAIAIGDKSNGYAYGRISQEKANKVSMEECVKLSTPSTCRISSRWHDVGRKLTDAEYAMVLAEWKEKQRRAREEEICGYNPATNLPVMCGSTHDVGGNQSGYDHNRRSTFNF